MKPNFVLKDYPSLTAVVHQTVLKAPSGLDTHTIAEIVGYGSYNTMMSELSRQRNSKGEIGHKLGADMLLPLMEASQSYAPMIFLARQCNGVFLRIPEPAHGGGELASALAASAREYSEFMQETAVSISDGDIPKDQLERIAKEGHEAIESIYAMITLAKRTHEAQHGSKS